MVEPYRIQLQQAVTAALEGATVPGSPGEAGFASPGVVVVTANTRAARNLLRECDRRRLTSQRAWRTPPVLPLEAWINELWRTAQVCGLLDCTLLGPAQQRALWERILEATPPAAPGGRRLAPLAAEAWELAHAYDVPLRSPQFHATAETQSFFSWADAFADQLAARKWADRARMLDLLLPRLSALKDFLPKRMVFVGFDRLTPQQRRLLAALAAERLEVTVVSIEPGAETTGDIRSIKLADRSTELHTAAAWARARLENDPAARVGVVVAGLAEIRKEVEQAFSAVLHPEQYFTIGDISQPAFDISLGPPLAEYPIIHSALTYLRLLAGPIARGIFRLAAFALFRRARRPSQCACRPRPLAGRSLAAERQSRFVTPGRRENARESTCGGVGQAAAARARIEQAFAGAAAFAMAAGDIESFGGRRLARGKQRIAP